MGFGIFSATGSGTGNDLNRFLGKSALLAEGQIKRKLIPMTIPKLNIVISFLKTLLSPFIFLLQLTFSKLVPNKDRQKIGGSKRLEF